MRLETPSPSPPSLPLLSALAMPAHTPESPASARSSARPDSPVRSDSLDSPASDDRSLQETAEVSATGSAPPEEDIAPADDKSSEADKKPDVKIPPDDPPAETSTSAKKRKRSLESDEPADTATTDNAPPLPTDEVPPPLPDEEPPAQDDDGWQALWDHSVSAYYFYNRHTGVTQWDNPRVPEAPAPAPSAAVPPAPGTTASYGGDTLGSPPRKRVGGYNPAIHGDFDPNADYAQEYTEGDAETTIDPSAAAAQHAAALGGDAYTQTGTFNRFTGRFQAGNLAPEQHNDENKSKRQLNAYFDVDAAANTHDGRSLKAERQNKKLSKKELQAFKSKAAKRKEEKRRAWLRD